GHVLPGHLVRVGHGQRDLDVRVVDRQDRRRTGIQVAVHPRAAGQVQPRIHLGRPVRAEPHRRRRPYAGHAGTSSRPGGGTKSAWPGSSSTACAREVSVNGTGTSASGGRPRYRRSTATAEASAWQASCRANSTWPASSRSGRVSVTSSAGAYEEAGEVKASGSTNGPNGSSCE